MPSPHHILLIWCLLPGLQERARASDRAAGCPWGAPWGRGARVEVRQAECAKIKTSLIVDQKKYFPKKGNFKKKYFHEQKGPLARESNFFKFPFLGFFRSTTSEVFIFALSACLTSTLAPRPHGASQGQPAARSEALAPPEALAKDSRAKETRCGEGMRTHAPRGHWHHAPHEPHLPHLDTHTSAPWHSPRATSSLI